MFKDAVREAARNNSALFIESFVPFQRAENRHLLQFLYEAEIDFHFFDFESLNKDSLQSVLELFELQSTSRKAQTEEASSRRKGNPQLQSEEIASRASRRRKQQAFFDNKEAMQKAVQLSNAGYSQNRIAQKLNEKGYITAKGKSFSAKQISRYLKRFEKLTSFFRINHQLEVQQDPLLADNEENKHPIPLDLEEHRDFDNLLEFEFAHPVKNKVRFEIKDNQSQTVLEKEYEEVGEKVIIDVLKDTTLFPGLHYLKVSAKGYKPVYRTFTIRKDLIDLPETK